MPKTKSLGALAAATDLWHLGRPQTGARERRHLGRQARRVDLQREQPDLVEDLFHPVGIERRSLGPQDALGGRRLRALVGVEELLVQLLPGPPADDLDRDVPPRLET